MKIELLAFFTIPATNPFEYPKKLPRILLKTHVRSKGIDRACGGCPLCYMMKKKKAPLGKRVWRMIKILSLSAAALLLVLFAGLGIYLGITVDAKADLALFEASRGSRTTRLYYNADRGGAVYLAKEWESERLFGSESAIWCPYSDIPPLLSGAFLAAEDRRFFSHGGIDLVRTVRALANEVLHFEKTFGASGITQQLVKNLTGDKEKSGMRKLREAYRALLLERSYKKEDILELYLNIVPMGEGCIGVGAGAERYFGKKPSELSAAECACLAAIINAPARYNPVDHPAENEKRRRVVLSEMRDFGVIDEEEYQKALFEEIRVLPTGVAEPGHILSWYTETVIDDVLSDLCQRGGYSRAAAMRLLYGGGLEIYTLVDPEVQAVMEESFSAFSAQDGVQYAGTVIDPATGDILGIIGGVGKKTGNRLLNHATVPHAPGSALKPLSVYAPAIDGGIIHSATVLDDVPLSFYEGGVRAWPKNSPEVYMGLCDLGTAIATSKNTVAVRVLRMLGKEKSYATLSHALRLSHLVRASTASDGRRVSDLDEAPLALGQLSYGTTVRELTSAYSALAKDGTFKKGRTYLAVYDKNGALLLSNEGESEQVFKKTTASIMTKELERVVKGGTANGVRLPGGIPVAGKTGTTTLGRDKWFVGYSPYYLCGIWCGSPLSTVSVAGRPQLAVFNTVMGRLHRKIAEEGNAQKEFSLASGVYECRFCRDGGGLMTVDCLHDPRGDRSTVGWFTADTLPTAPCRCHVGVLCAEGGGVVAEVDGTPISLAGRDGVPLRRYGLIRVEDRAFPSEVVISDAQYVYRTLAGGLPSLDPSRPYFGNIIPSGSYAGISRTADGRQFNSAYMEKQQDLFLHYEGLFE